YLGPAVGPSGKVYAAEPINSNTGTASVLLYSPDIVVPDPTTQAATEVEDTTATLHGHLDPDTAHGGGEITSCRFEYGPTKNYGETAPCTPAPNYSGPQDVSAHLTGLQPSNTYHFRIEAANANGIQSLGGDETLTTKGPPAVDIEAAEALTTSVTFKAKVNPWGYDTTCQVQYVADAAFQQAQWASATTKPCQPEDLGSGFGDVTTKFKVTGLARATTYRYRFLAANRAGLSSHPAGAFETYGVHRLSVEFVKNPSISFPGGFENWEGGEPEIHQAGAHPYELVTDVVLSHTTEFSGEAEDVNNTALNTKDIHINLPPGLIGNPTSIPRCNRYLLKGRECPSDTQVGMFEAWVDEHNATSLPAEEREERFTIAIYNIEPAGRAPAEFAGFIYGKAPVWIPFRVRTGGDYGISADSINITSIGGALSRVRARIWGVPADPAHEVERSHNCPIFSVGSHCPDTEPEVPLLTNPTACAGPLTVTTTIDSWQEPGQYVSKSAELEAFTGCNQLHFEPTLEALPTTNVADSPSGLNVDLHVPQDRNSEGNEDPHGLATADLKDTRVTLPLGLVVNPASAPGLGACSSVQFELHGPKPAQCPDAAKIGRVEIDTPLVDHPLPGSVYVATPYENPFDSLLAIYVAVDDPETGVVIKLAGDIEANPETGQLTTTFSESPQLPFEDFKLDFFAGPRAALRTSATCGTFESKSVLTPWSAPESGPPATWSSVFQIKSAPGGGSCPAKAAEETDSPSFSAGTETPVAGSYSPFVLRLHREDDSQELKGIATVLPPGLTAKLAGVAECSDSAIEAAQHKTGRQEQESPSCPASSEVGTVNVGAGAGPAPYFTEGRVYLAGPYKGAPFSLAILTPAVAGPYDLGTVVVRAALYVNPETTQVTVKSDPIPTILDGILLDVRTITVKIGRPDFTLNPTSCDKMSVGGEALSVLGPSAALSDPFQVGGCEALGFKPRFSVSTSGKTSRVGGASLHVTLAYPNAPQGTQANIKSVHVELPEALPSRLSTLRHACVDSVFNQNPTDCPALSQVGSARAVTPLIAVPLEGPAYFVSHGGQKFPELIVVLQGDGITIDLHGETFISHAGITSSTFRTVPDQPITSFELTLPQGPNSVFAANGNFCAATKTVPIKRRVTVRVKGRKQIVTRSVKTTVTAPLIMPTAFTAQNGAVLTQNTEISVEGCSRAKQKPTSKKAGRGKGRR
ncbi:MAG TPA: fibronectin type III domain-containing protein, partial [Solirubrobacteraceae bacterium]|nr:fibronectin type III domain-containing protein [Solirubrobacteraceae bacterium]